VIASEQARADIDAGLANDYGPELLHSRWWQPAQQSGLIELGNHSFDHNHPMVIRSAQRDNLRGNFLNIETEAEAEAEIAQASDEIERIAGFRPRWFAYPFGDVSGFLRDDWLPRRGPQIGLHAAFTAEPRALSKNENRWALPRYVNGRDWNGSEGLAALLAQA
jgi:peptidoglycan/xylan/chitin deacetylase (PgdA/CDA1 family)